MNKDNYMHCARLIHKKEKNEMNEGKKKRAQSLFNFFGFQRFTYNIRNR
jgi:hypothetical protein